MTSLFNRVSFSVLLNLQVHILLSFEQYPGHAFKLPNRISR
jgi:hypothetical protein